MVISEQDTTVTELHEAFSDVVTMVEVLVTAATLAKIELPLCKAGVYMATVEKENPEYMEEIIEKLVHLLVPREKMLRENGALEVFEKITLPVTVDTTENVSRIILPD